MVWRKVVARNRENGLCASCFPFIKKYYKESQILLAILIVSCYNTIRWYETTPYIGE